MREAEAEIEAVCRNQVRSGLEDHSKESGCYSKYREKALAHVRKGMTNHDPITRRFLCSLPSGLTAPKGHFINFTAGQSPKHASRCPGMQAELKGPEGKGSLCQGSHFSQIPTQPTKRAGSSP